MFSVAYEPWSTDRGELEEAEAEDLRAQLSKPTLLFVFRNVSGDINKKPS